MFLRGRKPVCSPEQDQRRALTYTFIGIIMSMHLYRTSHPSVSTVTGLRILMAFEAGTVEYWAFRPIHGKPHSIEGIGWERLWDVRFHAESGPCPSISIVPDSIAVSTEVADD